MYAQCLQTMHSVYMYAQCLHVCTVSTCMHSVYMYAQCLHVCTVSADYTRVNDISGTSFREGGPLAHFPNIVCSCLQHADNVCNLQTASACGARKRVCAQCLQTMHRIYTVCTVSACMHSVYRHCVSTIRIHGTRIYRRIRTYLPSASPPMPLHTSPPSSLH